VDWVRDNYVLTYKHSYHEIYELASSGLVPFHAEAAFGDEIRLWGYSVSPLGVDLGESLFVTLYWEVLSPIRERYHGFVHLLTADGERVGQDDQIAWSEEHASPSWRVGERLADRYELELPEDARAGPHLLSVGLYEESTGGRLEVRDADGQRREGSQLTLAVEPVVRGPARFEGPTMPHATEARFGEIARLLGYDVQPEGQQLAVRFAWECLSPDRWPGHKVYVHLRRADQVLAQHDSVPNEGTSPTYAWRPREVIQDLHVIDTAGLDEGEYVLYVGLYDPHTMARLPAYDGSERPLASAELRLEPVILSARR
jgi:hypothetical protein